ncbi:MAG: radical SAM protein [Candidatus Omnitrophota bacterium]
MKRAFLIDTNIGCTPGFTDLTLIKTYLNNNGWRLARKIESSNIVIVYTCACSKQAEDNSIDYIKKAEKEKNPNAQLIVSGCLPSINKVRLKRIFKGLAISANSLGELEKLLSKSSQFSITKYIYPVKNLKRIERKDVYHLRIGWGCFGKCTYCAVKFVFGRPRSRPIEDILKEYHLAYEKGYKKFVLVANDAGSYGLDLSTSLAFLVNKLYQEHSECKFFLSHFTPNKLKEMLPSLEDIIRSGKILRMNIPVQSGSDRIIQLMERPYTVDDFKYCIEKIIEWNPKLELKTDIIVGFPSETKRDFLDTLKLVEWLSSKGVFIQFFNYSKRPNTKASSMPGQISAIIKQQRFRKCAKVTALYSLLHNKKSFSKLKRDKLSQGV